MNSTNPNSIRQICLTGLLAKKTTKEIAEEIQAKHPNSAAAKKSVKHIAWYRADMKKRGMFAAAPTAE